MRKLVFKNQKWIVGIIGQTEKVFDSFEDAKNWLGGIK